MKVLDFETYSPVSLMDCGSFKYASHEEADIVCWALKHDDSNTRVGRADEVPNIDPATDFVYAHNAPFDYLVWHLVGVRKYGYPVVPLDRWIDSQALVNRYTLPGGLAAAGDVLNVSVQKDRRGKALIRKICVPTASGLRPRLGVDYTQEDLLDFIDYCRQDVDSTYALIKCLPSETLTETEQRYWQITQFMNFQGLPVDIDTAERILGYISTYSEEMMRRVPELTNGQVEKVTQTARMVDFINSRGVKMANLQAATVERTLKQEIPEDVRELLVLRQTLGRSSTAKFKKIKEMAWNGRVYNNLQYYGTSTGRWAGRGFQLQNLPRASVDNPDAYIDRFANFEPVDDPVNIAKALIRPMIQAKPGYKLIVSDYSSIENRLLAWVAGDEKALELFRTGGDQYVDMASFLYQKAAANIDKAERQIGKIIILGCGYGMGAKRFVETAKTWNVDLSHGQALAAVNAYRERYSLVKRLWYRLKDCAVSAIRNPGQTFEYANCKFRHVKCRAGNRWLVLTLPSGRNLFYMDPYVDDDGYGPAPGHYGTNPYTKKWSRLSLIPGRITENVIQALARDCMGVGLDNVHTYMPEITLLGTVHDEAISECQDTWINEETLPRFNKHLCAMPEWAAGLPLEAEGYIAERYRK